MLNKKADTVRISQWAFVVDIHRQIREAFHQKEPRLTRSLLGVLVNLSTAEVSLEGGGRLY